MDKADRAGLSVALTGHVLLFGALSLSLANIVPPNSVSPPAMEVEFVDAVSLEPASPDRIAETQSAEAPEVGLVEEAMPQPAPVSEPLPEAPTPEELPAPPSPSPAPAATPVPKPEPVRAKPVAKAAPKPQPNTKPALAKTATQTTSTKPAVAKAAPAKVAKLAPPKIEEPAPVKTRAVDRSTRTAAPAKPRQLATTADKPTQVKPAPAKPQRVRAAAANVGKPPTAPVRTASATKASGREAEPRTVRSPATKEEPARAPRLSREMLAGLTDAPDAKPAVATAPVMNPDAMAGIQAAIKRQVQPCADRQVNPGPGAHRISVKMNLKLNKDGSLASAPQVVSTSGIDDENSRYEKRVTDLAVAAFTGCAPLAGLPDELYRTSKGGWSNFIMNYRLPG